jgi:NADH-quinone oxidoreductase subunit L
MVEAIWLVPTFPLLGFIVLGVFGHGFSRSVVALIGCGSVALSFAAAIVAAVGYRAPTNTNIRYTWTGLGNGKDIVIGLLADPLSLTMLLTVTGVSLLIHIYSIGYMAHDEGFRRYFAYLNLFVFAMCLLVAADNYLLLLVGWANVGLASFLLIGFWFNRPRAVKAARLAIVVNVIGDAAIMLAIFLFIVNFGDPSYNSLLFATHSAASPTLIMDAILLLLVGAAAKSAQLPLYIWLPDAMEGPTPVSALMHAATMVTAGVYLMVRSAPLTAVLNGADAAFIHNVICWVGAATAIFAASVALAQRDIKRVLAYSTISQLGYMFLAIGVGANDAAIFHLVTHAFFKACLFLSAGIVIHALDDEQDMFRMGGLLRRMPLVAATFGVGTLALAAIPPFAGFFSKDAVLAGAFAGGYYLLWAVGVIVAFLTALYMGRAFLLTFGGQPRSAAAMQPHATDLSMIWTTATLALLSLAGGFIALAPPLVDVFGSFGGVGEGIAFSFGLSTITSLVLALVGLVIAYVLYGQGQTAVNVPGWLYNAVMKGWGLPALYHEAIVVPVQMVSRTIIIFFERGFLEEAIHEVRTFFQQGGRLLSRGETGALRNYALVVLLGVVVIVIYAISGGAK